jgi:hypothetical protein
VQIDMICITLLFCDLVPRLLPYQCVLLWSSEGRLSTGTSTCGWRDHVYSKSVFCGLSGDYS